MIRLSSQERVRHIIFWIVLTIYCKLIDPIQGNIIMQILVTFLIIANYIFVFYSLYLFLFPKFYNKKSLIIGFFIVYILYENINYFTFHKVMTFFGDRSTYANSSFFQWLLTSSIYFVVVVFVAIGAFRKREMRRQIEIQNENEKALLLKELGFYKNQFNAEITFVFLDYCSKYIDGIRSTKSRSVELFSQMLEYTMESDLDESVLLTDEVEYIRKYIELHKEINQKTLVSFEVKGDLKNKRIAPRILIIFVENAFKHGITEHSINILLESVNNNVLFKVINEINFRKKAVSTGVGLEIAKQQLEFFHKNKYTLNVDRKGEIEYLCELKLNLL